MVCRLSATLFLLPQPYHQQTNIFFFFREEFLITAVEGTVSSTKGIITYTSPSTAGPRKGHHLFFFLIKRRASTSPATYRRKPAANAVIGK
jgi:hypothetical protein